jgi:hypothetical protein
MSSLPVYTDRVVDAYYEMRRLQHCPSHSAEHWAHNVVFSGWLAQMKELTTGMEEQAAIMEAAYNEMRRRHLLKPSRLERMKKWIERRRGTMIGAPVADDMQANMEWDSMRTSGMVEVILGFIIILVGIALILHK